MYIITHRYCGRWSPYYAGAMDTIDLITFSLYVSTFVNPVRKLSNFAELFANGTAGLHRFVELLNTKPN